MSKTDWYLMWKEETPDSNRLCHWGRFELTVVMRDADNPDTPRNICWGSFDCDDVQHLDGLIIHCQFDDTDFRPYAWRTDYDPSGNVVLGYAEAMTRTLRALQRKMKKFDDKWGRAESFGQYAQRVGMLLGATGWARKVGGNGFMYSQNEYRFDPLSELPSFIRWRLDKMLEGSATG